MARAYAPTTPQQRAARAAQSAPQTFEQWMWSGFGAEPIDVKLEEFRRAAQRYGFAYPGGFLGEPIPGTGAATGTGAITGTSATNLGSYWGEEGMPSVPTGTLGRAIEIATAIDLEEFRRAAFLGEPIPGTGGHPLRINETVRSHMGLSPEEMGQLGYKRTRGGGWLYSPSSTTTTAPPQPYLPPFMTYGTGGGYGGGNWPKLQMGGGAGPGPSTGRIYGQREAAGQPNVMGRVTWRI